MLWAAYGRMTQEGIKGMATKPQNRAEAVSKLVEALCGKMISYHMLLNGDIDFLIVVDMPDDKAVNVALINPMLVRTAGGVAKITTVPAILAEKRGAVDGKGQGFDGGNDIQDTHSRIIRKKSIL